MIPHFKWYLNSIRELFSVQCFKKNSEVESYDLNEDFGAIIELRVFFSFALTYVPLTCVPIFPLSCIVQYAAFLVEGRKTLNIARKLTSPAHFHVLPDIC